MNAFLGLFKFIIVVALIVFSVVIVVCGVLVLFPSFKLFGLHYISGDANQEVETVSLSGTDFNNADKIRFKTDTFDVYLRTVKSSQLYDNGDITIENFHRLSGFVWGDVEFPSLLEPTTITENGQTILVIQLAEPSGVLFKTNACMAINCVTGAFANKDIEIQTTSGSVYVGDVITKDDSNNINSSITVLKNIGITCDTGAIDVRSCNITGELNVKKLSGNLTVERDLTNDANISISAGFGKINLQNVGSSTTTANLVLNSIDNSDIVVGAVYGDTILVANGGLLRMNYVQEELSVNSTACDIQVTRIGQNLIVDGNEGKIDIDVVEGNVTINQSSGSVDIAEVDGTMDIETTRGNINLPNVSHYAKIRTTFGAVNIVCDGTSIFNLDIRTQSGAVNVENLLGSITYQVVNNGTANVNVEFLAIRGVNTIQTEAGNINITVPTATDYYLKWSTTRSVDIQLYSYQSTDKTGQKGMGETDIQEDYAKQILLTSIVGSISVIKNV